MTYQLDTVTKTDLKSKNIILCYVFLSNAYDYELYFSYFVHI